MKYLKARNAAAKGVVHGLKYGFSLYAKELEAFEKMQESQRKAFVATTDLMQDMKSNAEFERDIQNDLERRLR